MKRLCVAVIVLGVLAAAGPSSAGGREDLYAALDKERTEGDLGGALALYRKAAADREPRVRMEARLGEGRCLRRLGRPEEAREALTKLIEAGPPADLLAAAEVERARAVRAIEASQAEVTRGELERARAEADRLRAELERAEGGREEIERLKASLLEKDALVSELGGRLEKLRAAREDEREKGREAEKDLELRKQLAEHALAQARWAFREARFDEARAWLGQALTQDPLNAEAHEMLSRLGDAPSDRERLLGEVLRLLDFERRVRANELRMEADSLLSSGLEQLVQGRPEAAAARARECIALVAARPGFAAELRSRGEQAESLLVRAVLRGAAEKPPAETPEASGAGAEEAWRETLRALLLDLAASPRPDGARLKIHDLPPPVAAEAESPDPESPGTPGLALSRDPVDAGDLYVALVPELVEPGAWGHGGSVIRRLGSSLAVHAPEAIHGEIEGLLERAETRQDAPVRVVLTAFAVEPARLPEASRTSGVAFRRLEAGAVTVLDARGAAYFRKALLGPARGEVLGEIELDLDPGRAVRAERTRSLNSAAPARSPGERRFVYGFFADLLPLRTGSRRGLALSAEVRLVEAAVSLPHAGGGEVQVPSLSHERMTAAARLPDGGALVLVGLQNPFSAGPFPKRSWLVVMARMGRGGASVPEGAVPAEPEPPAPGKGREIAAIDLTGLDPEIPDDPSPAFRGEAARADESRAGFLLRYLYEAIGTDAFRDSDVSLTVNRGKAWIVGGQDLKVRARDAVANLRAGRDKLVSIRIRAASVTNAEEASLIRGLTPGGRVLGGEGVGLHLLEDEARLRVGYGVTGSPGRIPFLSDALAARSLQLVSVVRATRLTFLEEYRRGERDTLWPAYSEAEQGLAVDLRPVVLADGRVDLHLTARVARIHPDDPGPASPGGLPRVRSPVLTVSDARVAVLLDGKTTLLLSGLPAPTPVKDRRERLVLLADVRVTE